MSNPLLEKNEFVNYNDIKPAHVLPAVEASMKEAKERIESILNAVSRLGGNGEGMTFSEFIHPFIEAESVVSRAWSPVSNLLALDGGDELREEASKARPKVVEFGNDVTLDPRVYEMFSLYSKSKEGLSLEGERKRYIENTLRDLKLMGAGLSEEKKTELKALNIELAELSRKFSDNVTDSKVELILTKKEDLSGLPEDFIKAAKLKADQYREKLGEDKIPQGACLINLDYPSYIPFMRYSDRGDLRKDLSYNFLQQGTSRATGGLLEDKENKKDLDNHKVILDLLKNKKKKAQLLGFKNFSELSLQVKMAKDPKKVISFLEKIAEKAKPVAISELKALAEFQKSIAYKNTESREGKVFSWDREYLSEKYKKQKFDFDANVLKPYFELENTIKGMFSLIETLFSVRLEKLSGIAKWHQDVDVYAVTDEKGQRKGILYFDLFPRDTKRQGAWVNPLLNTHKDSRGDRHVGQCVLACNLTPATKDQPSLLSMDEARTLFHEMGHALHHVLSDVELEPLGGLNVAWDFVELPSQLFENFLLEEVSLKKIAKHYQTGEEIPDGLIEKIKQGERFLSGIFFIRQLEFGLFDMEIYSRDNVDAIEPDQVFKEIVSKYGVFDYWEGTHFPYAFSHIFGGGYAAGYYSYKWAEVLEADAFNKFKEDGVLSAKVGREYRDKILAKGDSEEPMKLYKDFMGREPDEVALLERLQGTI
jgi:Zn-dependent oligopeptidase